MDLNYLIILITAVIGNFFFYLFIISIKKDLN